MEIIWVHLSGASWLTRFLEFWLACPQILSRMTPCLPIPNIFNSPWIHPKQFGHRSSLSPDRSLRILATQQVDLHLIDLHSSPFSEHGTIRSSLAFHPRKAVFLFSKRQIPARGWVSFFVFLSPLYNQHVFLEHVFLGRVLCYFSGNRGFGKSSM